MGNIFTGKNTVSLDEVLENRDYRRSLIEKTMSENFDKSILSYKLNIPGPEKNNEKLRKLFDMGLDRIVSLIEKEKWPYEIVEIWDKKTGKEAIFVVDIDGKTLKKATVALEEELELARLYDIDISYKNKDISRIDIGKKDRECFICKGPVSICSRSRKHSVGEMQTYIEKILDGSF